MLIAGIFCNSDIHRLFKNSFVIKFMKKIDLTEKNCLKASTDCIHGYKKTDLDHISNIIFMKIMPEK